ncbi:MAG: transcriptional repressor LexA [Candidatus Delongbacteria bacterium]|nr:transcriptional repressor LexA [Candidatus Delongbacteria bacterium]
MIKKDLTTRQSEIYEFIRNRIEQESVPPSLREIGKVFCISSSNGVRENLLALERKGYIIRNPKLSRSIQLTRNPAGMDVPAPSGRSDSAGADRVPHLGKISAGQPLWAEENIVEMLDISPTVFHTDRVFALKVQGDSMINAGICDGDLIMVHPQSTLENNQIGVFLLDHETTVKRFRHQDRHYILQPENPHYTPLIVRDGHAHFRILGKVVGLLRHFPC